MRGSFSDYVFKPEEFKDIPPPIQLDKSVDEYFNQIKLYATVLDIDLDNQDLKKKFFNGLLLENKKDMIQFGFKKLLNVIVDHLNRISSGPANMQKFQFGGLRQDSESIIEYYRKVEKCDKLAKYNGEQLRYFFLRELSPDNQIEARRCELELPLDKLIE
ncbi:17095_t:CDS:2, partial [Dentiscutata erythropus]